MLIVQIDGPLDTLRQVDDIADIEFQRGMHDLGDGNYRRFATLHRNEAKDEIEALGLTVNVTLDEAEIDERSQSEMDTMRAAYEESGEDGSGGTGVS